MVEEARRRTRAASAGRVGRVVARRRRRARRGTASCAGPRPGAAVRTGRSRAARRARPASSVFCAIAPSASGGHAAPATPASRGCRAARRAPRSVDVVLGHPAHERAHQRLGHARVHVVHRDVIAGEGAPAERQLREIAGADVRGRLPCWRGPSAPACARAPAGSGRSCWRGRSAARPMSRDVLAAGGADVDLAQRDAQRRAPARARCPSVRAVVPKPGMVTARIPSRGRPSRSNVRAATSSASVGVEPAREAEHDPAQAGVLEPLGQARGLDRRRSRGSARRAWPDRRARTDAGRRGRTQAGAARRRDRRQRRRAVALRAAACTASRTRSAACARRPGARRPRR